MASPTRARVAECAARRRPLPPVPIAAHQHILSAVPLRLPHHPPPSPDPSSSLQHSTHHSPASTPHHHHPPPKTSIHPPPPVPPVFCRRREERRPVCAASGCTCRDSDDALVFSAEAFNLCLQVNCRRRCHFPPRICHSVGIDMAGYCKCCGLFVCLPAGRGY